MDVDITIFDSSKVQLARGMDIGATETVVFKATRSGRYKVQLSYRNSIIRDLMSCPQVHLYISSLSESRIKEIGVKQNEILTNSESSFTKIEKVFSLMQNAINSGSAYNNSAEFEYIYLFNRESFSNLEESVYSNKLSISDKPYWIYIEIF